MVNSKRIFYFRGIFVLEFDFRKIIDDYKAIINTQYIIPLSNGKTIDFTFKGEHLPHLLGLNNLVDIPILERYANKLDKEIGGNYIWKGICEEDETKTPYIDTNTFLKSRYYNNIYEDKLKYFDLKRLLKPMKIIEFDPNKVKDFVPKIEKVCYMFWDYVAENGERGHFGIGFSLENDKHFPNTFFYRSNNDYLDRQNEVFPHSYFKKHQNKEIDFYIYWSNIRNSLSKTSHYKYLKKHEPTIGLDIIDMNHQNIIAIESEEITRHFDLMQLEEVRLAYLPYLENAKSWNNVTKHFLVQKIEANIGDYKPSEIKSLLNEIPKNS